MTTQERYCPNPDECNGRFPTLIDKIHEIDNKLNLLYKSLGMKEEETKTYFSECCGAPFSEPGYPDTDLCSQCHEHTGAYLD